MAKSGELKSGKVRLFSEEVLATTNTHDGSKSDSTRHQSGTVSFRYTSAGQNNENQTINGRIPDYSSSLPVELDIFNHLPQLVYGFREAKDFLNDLRAVIVRSYLQSELENLVLSKLTVSEYSDTGVVIDWIFNYFQMYFTFDKKNGSYWGTVMADNEEGEFCNSVIKIRSEKRMEQAQAVLATAVMLIR